MDSQCRPSILSQVLSDIIGNALGSDKDQDFSILGADVIQVLDKFGAFLEITADFNNLLDVVVGGEFHRTNVDLNKIPQKVLTKG